MSPILNSPSAQRNKDPIWNVLKEYCLPTKTNESIHILEVAAGTGVHTMYFASQFAHSLSSFNNNIHWYPTDPDETARASITGRIQKKDEEITTETNNVIIHTPICMTLNENGPMEKMTIKEDMDLMICINMIHVAPWEATIGLMKLASQKLSSNGGKLCMYGPYKIKGKTADSNLAFDASLKSRDPSWGIRDLENVIQVAEENGLTFERMVEMPVNNWCILFQKQA